MLSRNLLKISQNALTTTSVVQAKGQVNYSGGRFHALKNMVKTTLEDAELRHERNYGNKDKMFLGKKASKQKEGLIEAAMDHKDFCIEMVNGLPDDVLKNRRVRIYKPSRNPMQSGVQNLKSWRVEFNVKEKWENPAMGWGSTADPISNIAGWLKFKTKEDAIAFVTKQGWAVSEINDPNEAKPVRRTYGDNFSWTKRTRVGMK